MGFKTQQIVLKMDTHGLKSGSKELWPFGTKNYFVFGQQV